MMSSLHCKIRVGTETLEGSARLSDLKVTRANALAICRIRPAEAVRELLAEFRPVRIAHDGGRHRSGPAHVVVLEKLAELFDLLLAEPAHIANVVDVSAPTGRRAPAARTCRAPSKKPERRSLR
jgi:hypothetical protein